MTPVVVAAPELESAVVGAAAQAAVAAALAVREGAYRSSNHPAGASGAGDGGTGGGVALVGGIGGGAANIAWSSGTV